MQFNTVYRAMHCSAGYVQHSIEFNVVLYCVSLWSIVLCIAVTISTGGRFLSSLICSGTFYHEVFSFLYFSISSGMLCSVLHYSLDCLLAHLAAGGVLLVYASAPSLCDVTAVNSCVSSTSSGPKGPCSS